MSCERGASLRVGLQLAAAATSLLLMAACGGQSGAEGGSGYPGLGLPGPGTSCYAPTVDELPFETEWIEELANGRHESSFRWRTAGANSPSTASGDDDLSIRIDVTQRGATRTSKDCGGVSAYIADVDVTMNGSHTAAFKGRVHGSEFGAFIVAYAGLDVRKTLGVPGAALTGEDDPGYEVVVRVDEQGARGDFYFAAGSTGECRLASWPADRTCSPDAREVPGDEKFAGSSLATEVASLIQREQRLTWRHGSSTTIALEIKNDGTPVCIRASSYAYQLKDGTRPDHLSQRVALRIKSEDGRVDMEVPATISALWTERAGFTSTDGTGTGTIDHVAQLYARVIGHFDPRTAEGEFDMLELQAFLGIEAVSGTLNVNTVKLKNPPPALTQKDAPPLTMENGECWGIQAGSRSESATLE